MFYNARMYDPALGRFTSADSIVPAGVQGYDRYAYVSNNPLRYIDPSGHSQCDLLSGYARTACNGGGYGADQRQLDMEKAYKDDPSLGFSDLTLDIYTRGSETKPITGNPALLFYPPTFTPDYTGVGESTVLSRAFHGDISSWGDLLLPTHGGWRMQGEMSISTGLSGWGPSGSLGVNFVCNRISWSCDANIDVTSELYAAGAGGGFSSTGGPLVGWGS
jgi:hypothetical protein